MRAEESRENGSSAPPNLQAVKLLLSYSSASHSLCLPHEPTWLLQLQPSALRQQEKEKEEKSSQVKESPALISSMYIPLARTSHRIFLAARESVNLLSIKNKRRKGCLIQQALKVICYQFCPPVSMALLCFSSSVALPQLPLGSAV